MDADSDELNRLVQNALNVAAARHEQNLEERITALREEIEKKHQEEMIAFKLQDQFCTIKRCQPNNSGEASYAGINGRCCGGSQS